MSKLLSQLRADNPRYSHYDDDRFIDLISEHAGIPRDDLVGRLGLDSSPAPTKSLSKIDQLRKENPRYAHYDDERWIGLVAEQTGSSPEEAAALLGYQAPKPEVKEEDLPSGVTGLLGSVWRGAKQAGRNIGAMGNTVSGDLSAVEGYAERSQEAAEKEMPVEQRKLQSELQSIDREQGALGQIGDTLGAAWDNKMGTGQLITEQLPNSAVSLGSGFAGFKAGAALGAPAGPVGAAVGGAVGFLSGMFLGTYMLEGGSKAIEKAEGGFTEEERKEALQEGAIKAGVITGIDAATLKLGGVIANRLGGSLAVKNGARAEAEVLMKAGVDMSTPETIATALSKTPELMKEAKRAGERAAINTLSTSKKAGIAGSGLALETAGEGAGEYLGEVAATGEGDVVDATIEALAGFSQSAVETAYNYNRIGNKMNAENITQQADAINAERLKLGLDKIVNSGSVDEAINAAAETAAQQPIAPGDVFDDAAQREELLRRTEAFTQGAVNEETQEASTEQPIQAAEVLNQPDALDSILGQQPKQATARDTEIVLPDNSTMAAQWDIVDAAKVGATMQEGTNQPRDRTRAASESQIAGIASNPNYSLVSDSPVMDIGAPVISQDGSIVAGNGRFEGLSRAYQSGTAQQYKERLIADAERKGIDPAIIANMERPVLVRRVTQPFDTRKMAIKSNSGMGLQYSLLELAKIDSERMQNLSDIEVSDNGDIALNASNIARLRDAFKDYNAAELGALIGKDGSLSQEGVRRVKSALLFSAFGNSDTLSRMIESTDNEIRNVVGALTKVAGDVAKVKRDIKSGAIPADLDITNDLLDATEKIAELKAMNMPIEAYLAQESMFSDVSDESKEIIKLLSDNMRSQKKMAEFIRAVYDGLGSIDTTTADIFGDTTLPTKSEVIQNAKQRTGEQTERQGDIFSQPNAEAGTEARQKTESKKDDAAGGEEARYSRSAEERLKDDDRARRLEAGLRKQGYDFTIKAVALRDVNAENDSRRMEAAAAEQIARIFRKRITWIKAEGPFGINGVIIPNISDTIFIDARTPKFTTAVMGHELSHHMKIDAPKAYADMVAALKEIIPSTKEYAEQYDLEGMADEDIIEEIVGDIMGDNFTKQAFWNKVAAYNPNAFRKLADVIVSWLKKFFTNAKMRGLESEKWVKDAVKAQDIIAKAVAQYTYTESSLDGLKNKAMFMTAWHGSPHDHDKFDMSKVGTGEGAAAYGHGLYFAGNKEVAEYYRNQLSGVKFKEKSTGRIFDTQDIPMDKMRNLHRDFEQYKGKLYQVELAPKPDEYLLWDKPLSEQSDKVKRTLLNVSNTVAGKEGDKRVIDASLWYEADGRSIYQDIAKWFSREDAAWNKIGVTPNDVRNVQQAASNYLHSLGIRGIKYLDGDSRSEGDGSFNFVLFDDKDVEITAKFSKNNNFYDQGDLFGDNSAVYDKPKQEVRPMRQAGLFDRQQEDNVGQGEEAATESQDTNQSITKPTDKIEDFGEKLGGARKDLTRSLSRELSDDDIATEPFSKLWPAIDVHAIEDAYVAAANYAARALVPAKPRTSYKIARWVESVKVARNIARLISSEGSKERFREFISKTPSLLDYAAKVRLLEQVDRDAWKRIDYVKEYPNAYTYGEDKQKIPKPQVAVKIDDRTQTFYGGSNVDSVIEQVKEALVGKPQDKKMAFEVRGRQGSYFINKKGDKEYRKLKTFTELKEAFHYIKNNHDDLVAAWEGVKDRDNVKKSDVRGAENRPRTSEDYRKGEDVTPEQFQETFGFRGVEFGNWVSQGKNMKERQGMLNEAYDALMDLASITNVPPKAISLNGDLGLGFGSRGSGSASAHYETSALVINLTKTRGAGSLAHEWFHALDNYFSRQRGAAGNGNKQEDHYITYKPEPLYIHRKTGGKGLTLAKLERYRKQHPDASYYAEENWVVDPKHPAGVRPEVEARFSELVKSLDESPMLNRARKIDKIRDDGKDGYWSSIIERAARSFENYVIHEMMMHGYNNDYLANVVSVEQFQRDHGRYPYLLENEIAPVAEAFNNLFGEIKTKETGKGVALFSRAAKKSSGDNSGAESLPDTIDIDGNDRPTRNSNGQLIAQDEEGIKNFYNWFGDSKVVDKLGRPLVVYHGTRSDFDVFEPSNPRGAFGNKKGIYFDTDMRVAEEYSEDDGGGSDEKSRIVAAYVRVKNDSEGLIKPRTERGLGQMEVLVFSPEQIKSAIGSTGQFSPESDDIRFSRADIRELGYPKSAGEPISEFSTTERLKLHREYKKAKSGDISSALKLVTDLVSEKSLSLASERFGGDVIYLPVVLQESAGVNRIPHALASLYASHSNAEVETKVFEQEKAFHTGMNMMERLISRASFTGEIEAGKRYVLVDDVTTSGATLSDLASYVQSNGGEVAGSVLLTNAMRSDTMLPIGKTIQALENKYGNTIKELFGINTSALTREESQYLLGFRTDDELRNRAAKAIDSRRERILKKESEKSEDQVKFNRTENQLVSKLIDDYKSIYNELMSDEFINNNDFDKWVELREKADAIRSDISDQLESGKANGIGVEGDSLLSRNTTDPKNPWRITYLTKDGEPNGHSEYKSAKAAVDDFLTLSRTKKEMALFSRAATLANAGVNTTPQAQTQAGALPEETSFQGLRRKTQDAMLRFAVVQDWLKEQGVNLTEAANVYQRQNISKGKTANKIEDFRNKQLEPLIKDIAKAKFTLTDITTYLEALHIPEANARMRQIHGDPDATANGIDDAAAQRVIADFQAMPNFAAFEQLANQVRAIGEETLEMRLNAGLITQEQYDAYKNTYAHWVPLRGNRDKQQGAGKGLSTSAKDKRRFGHEFREDEFILENLIQDRERAIIQIEKNKVGLSVLEFLMQANNPEIGTVGAPEKQATIKDHTYAVEYKGRVVGSFQTKGAADAAIVRVMNGQGTLPISGQVHASDLKVVKSFDPHVVMMTKPMLAENEIQVYINGKAVRMQLNDTMLAHAATNAGIEQVGAIVEAARGFNRFLSKAYTAYSPDFTFMNLLRDMYSGTIVLTGKKGAQFAAKTFANYGTAMKELIKGRKDPARSQWVTRYREAGGNIGAAYLSDLERVGEDALLALQTFAGAREAYRMVYDEQIAQGASKTKAATMAAMRAGRTKARSIPVLGNAFQIIERINMIVENALRLATFKTAIEAGESDQQAAVLSKDLMNFNRKGEMASQMGAAYLFFNPGMQGAHIVGEALFTSPHKKQVWAMLGALTTLSFLLAEIGRGGDDDDEREWQNIPDHVKHRNLVLKFGDTQATIPVAYGFGMFHSMGGFLSDLVHGEDPQKVAIKMASSLFDNFSVFGNPIEAGDEKTNFNLTHVLPTALKIGVGPGANIDGLGRPIHPESYSDAQPDSTLMTRAVRGTIYEDLASFLNDNTGGSKYNPGAIDISPNTMKYWVTSLFGGAGRFVSDTVTGSMDMAGGVVPDLENRPVIRKFIRESGVADARSGFWKAAKEAQAAATRFNKSVADGDVYAAQKLLDENADIIALAKYSRDSSKMASAARDEILEIQKDESLSRVEKKVRIKEIEAEEKRVYDSFLRAFDQAKNPL